MERKNFHKLETQSWYIAQISSVATLHPVLAASALILEDPEANTEKKTTKNQKKNPMNVSLIDKDGMQRVAGGSVE